MNIVLGITFFLALLSFIMTVFKDLGLTMIFNLDAFLIVVGGTTIAILVGFPVKRITDTVKDIISAFSKEHKKDSLIADILDTARMYRKTDIQSIEKRVQQSDSDFFKMGVNLLVNDYSGKEINNLMKREMMLRTINYNFSQNLLKTVARLTPSFGLAGTVISLIRMFKHFDSVDAVAPMMAVALMSTLYGVIIANLFMMPLCAKIRELSIISESEMIMTIDGIIAIKNMEHPLKIEEKIRGYREIDLFGSDKTERSHPATNERWQHLMAPMKYLSRTIREVV